MQIQTASGISSVQGQAASKTASSNRISTENRFAVNRFHDHVMPSVFDFSERAACLKSRLNCFVCGPEISREISRDIVSWR